MKFLSDLISLKNFLMIVYMRGSKFFLGRRRGQQEDNVGEGVGEALFPIIWITMLSYKFYNFQNLDGGFRPHLPFRPAHGHHHAYSCNRTKQ